MEWIAWGCVALFAAAGWLLVAGELFVLDKDKQLGRRLRDRFGLNVRDPAETVGKALLVACAVVGVYAFAYSPALPDGAQPDQEFEVVLGCDVVARRGMPTVAEQSFAQTRCYLVTLLAAVAPECEAVSDKEPEERKRDADRACRRQLTELGVYGALLFSAGFATGSMR